MTYELLSAKSVPFPQQEQMLKQAGNLMGCLALCNIARNIKDMQITEFTENINSIQFTHNLPNTCS